MWLFLAVACWSQQAPSGRWEFVRGGAVGPDGAFEALDWKPGQAVSLGGNEQMAPAIPTCVPQWRVELEDVGRLVARGGDVPDTVVVFSPDNQWLAVGTVSGRVILLDVHGTIVAEHAAPEALIRSLAFSPDSTTLYVGEQSPDATLSSLAVPSLSQRASLNLSKFVESSALPPGDDLFGVYSLPAAYGMEVLPDGGLIVSAAHGWNVGEERRNRSVLLNLGPDLDLRHRFPPENSADAVFGALALGTDGVAVSVRRSASGAPQEELPIDGVWMGSLDLKPTKTHILPRIEPFGSVFVWEALELDPLLIGTGDGRLVVGDQTRELTTPVTRSDVPIAASIGFAGWAGRTAFAVSGSTMIPYGAADPSTQPPSLHPGENTLWSLDASGEVRWSWRGPQPLTGLTIGPSDVLVGAGVGSQGPYGGLVFPPDAPAGSIPTPTMCSTSSPVFWRHALAPDRRVALVEVPYAVDGEVRGSYAVSVFR